MKKRLIITESEKEQILSLYKPVISEDIKGTSYFTENPQRIYYNPATKSLGMSDYIDIKKGTEFKKATLITGKGASAWNGKLLFDCKGSIAYNLYGVKWEENFYYSDKKEWLYNDVLSKKLKSIFCKVGGKLVDGCIKGDCNNGQGTYTSTDSDGIKYTYTGSFKNGKANGKGKQTWSNGKSFAGNFKDGKKSGYGEFTWTEGDVYKGQWSNDLKTGYGVYLYPEGNVYKGQWSNNLKTGYGVMTYYDGSYYKGNWKDGSKNGNGTYKNSKGIEFSGNWVDDKLNGKKLSELDELDKPITPPSSNPQTPVGSNPVDNNPQVVSPVGDDVNSPQDVKGFQDWLDLNHSGWTTNKTYQTLDKQLSRGYGKYGPLTKAAWASYKDEYLQSKPKPEVESPVNNPPVETPDV